jgi:ZIP family zinc transporter
MSTGHILLLGLLAGATIFIGLPMGRLHDVGQSFKAFLSATATGILLFLLWDVLTEAVEPVEDALNARDWGQFSGYAALAFGGFAVGLLSLVYYDSWMKARRRKSFLGPGAASATELERSHFTGLTPARWLALFIATGIGLHNFSEGLAIGQAASLDNLSLAYVLVIGFGLHNATEGFGIVAPLSGDAEPPSWRFLALLGVIGGFPTFFGTVVGQAWTSTGVSILFLSLAAGSILYVVMELLNVCRLFSTKTITAWGLLLGLTLGFATDFVLVAAGV